MLSSYHGHTSIVRLLLSHSADPNRLNERGQSPLAGAVFKMHSEVIEALLEGVSADPGLTRFVKSEARFREGNFSSSFAGCRSNFRTTKRSGQCEAIQARSVDWEIRARKAGFERHRTRCCKWSLKDSHKVHAFSRDIVDGAVYTS